MIFVKPALAQCPVCVVTVGGGMLLAQKLGIDDLLVSIWISALNTVVSYWLAPKFKIKFLKNPLILSLIMLGLTLSYFQFTDQLGSAENRILGIDKIVVGQTLGMVAIIAGNLLYTAIKARRGGKTPFPYAKVAFPFSVVLIVTLVFKFAFKL